MKVAIVAGIVVAHDAISAAVAGQAGSASTIAGVESVTVFAQHIDRDLPCRSHMLSDPWKLYLHPDFADADVVIFHWGIRYDLFDVLTLAVLDSRRHHVVHFHNCTPRELVDESDRENIDRSLAQLSHAIGLGIRFWTFSEFNIRTLTGWGVERGEIAFVPFPIELPPFLSCERTWNRVELLSIGRRVAAKGMHTIIAAVGLLHPRIRSSVRLRIAGSASFSNPAYEAELRNLVIVSELSDIVEFIDEPSDEQLWDLLRSSDVIVSASLHEGLCVPIIEAYAFGCRAIGTEAGNLPHIVQPPDPVVPTADPEALCRAIAEVVEIVGMESTKSRRNDELVDLYSPASSRALLQRELYRLAASNSSVADGRMAIQRATYRMAASQR